MSDSINVKDKIQVEKAVALENGPKGDGLMDEIIAIEALFKKQINKQQAEVIARLEKGQHEINVLNMLLNAVNSGAQEDGLQINDTIKQGIARLLQLDPNALQDPFVDPKTIPPITDDLSAEEKKGLENKRKIAIDRLSNEANILSRLNLPFSVTYAGKEADFQNLIAELNVLENAQHPLKTLFDSIGFDGGQPTEQQLQQISAAANQADPAKPDALYDNRAMRELLQKHNLLDLPGKLDKRAAQQLSHSLQSLMKEKEAINNLDQKKSSELESRLNKMYEALLSIIKKLGDAIGNIARNIKG